MPNCNGVRVLLRMLERIGGVDLGFELDRLDGRTLETERLRALASAFAADALHLIAARERVGVVLQRDRAPDGAGGGVKHDEAAFDKFGGGGQSTHGFFSVPILSPGSAGAGRGIRCPPHRARSRAA